MKYKKSKEKKEGVPVLEDLRHYKNKLFVQNQASSKGNQNLNDRLSHRSSKSLPIVEANSCKYIDSIIKALNLTPSYDNTSPLTTQRAQKINCFKRKSILYNLDVSTFLPTPSKLPSLLNVSSEKAPYSLNKIAAPPQSEKHFKKIEEKKARTQLKPILPQLSQLPESPELIANKISIDISSKDTLVKEKSYFKLSISQTKAGKGGGPLSLECKPELLSLPFEAKNLFKTPISPLQGWLSPKIETSNSPQI